ncbi:MAG: error-prone DNA polymerase [Planctomycetaceae bacterium]
MRYAELHCRSNFSFLEAASHPEELVARAASLGYAAVAITDCHSVAGIVRAHTAAKDRGIKLIIGAEISPTDSLPVVLWVKNRQGYAQLCRLITRGRRRAEKGECLLTFDDVAEHAQDVIAGVLPDFESEDMTRKLHRYRDLFGERCYLLAELHQGTNDAKRVEQLQRLSRQTNMPLVAAGGVLYHTPARQALQDTLTAIRHGVTVAAAGELLLPNAQRHLKETDELRTIFSEIPKATNRTMEIADACTFSLDELRYEYPEELAPDGQPPIDYLRTLTWQGAANRYPDGVPEKIKRIIEHELRLIADLRYEAYFLTVWDIVRFARSRNILCQGRGSAANSIVCFCLGVTSVDPARADVLFERFISRERDEAPDIDVDFEHERREEVLQYLYDKYGRERTGLTAVTITYRSRSAIRDVGKALGLSLDLVDRLAKNGDGKHDSSEMRTRSREVGLDPLSETGKRFVYLVGELIGFPRHLSQHVGGMVMTRGPLHELVPIENAAMKDRTVIQWNKDDLDALGILKVDCLALGMLTAIHKCFDLVRQTTERELTIANIPEGDAAVYDMICKADTMGVFQIESRAQMSMLPRLKPRSYYDLVIEVAIVRPGPIQGNMIHPYLRRRKGEEEATYPNDEVREVLQKTLGVPLFQEQCMRLAVVAAGFTPGEADQLRRAMGAWRRPGIIDDFRKKLLDGMRHKGLDEKFAEQVFEQIRGFGEYGFPESHAASFALLVYVSAWLKHHHPAEFAAALLNSQPMGFYAPAQLVQDARKHGVDVTPIDVNHSGWDCTMEGGSLRLGLRLIRGLTRSSAEAIEFARQDGAFVSMNDFQKRTQLPKDQLAKLADADAFGSLGQNRRLALWHALAQEKPSTQRTLFDMSYDDEPEPALPVMDLVEQVYADYRTTSLSLRPHPLSFQRDALNRLNVTPAGDLPRLPHDQRVKVAGLVIIRQRPSTAKGITFVTLEDETGIANLVVHQKTWERYRTITRHSAAWIAHGRVETKDSVIHVVVQHLEDMSTRLANLRTTSRDFR